MKTEIKGVNVASKVSTSGHFVQEARKVVSLDEVKDTYFVEGKSKLVTKNHTTLKQDKECLITTQVVYNPFSKMFEQSDD
ncbi:MAG: hypothetical protein ACRCX2_09645 [Paraclostridium sp.]